MPGGVGDFIGLAKPRLLAWLAGTGCARGAARGDDDGFGFFLNQLCARRR
jgi:hypothetical protein